MTEPTVDPAPAEQRLTPYLIVRGAAAAIAFYARAFGAVEELRLVDPQGRVAHAELRIAGARVMLADEHPEHGALAPPAGGAAVTLCVQVPDADGIAARAAAAGATPRGPVTDRFYGERVADLRDPFGHQWSFQQRLEALSAEELRRRFAALCR